MSKAKTIHLWPVEGRSLPGVPVAEIDADEASAAVLEATGAFTRQQPAQPVTED